MTGKSERWSRYDLIRQTDRDAGYADGGDIVFGDLGGGYGRIHRRNYGHARASIPEDHVVRGKARSVDRDHEIRAADHSARGIEAK